MGFDFPASPSEGAVYAPAGGPQYTFTNGAWRMVGTPTPLVATADTYNRVVNGAMQISQENGDTTNSTNGYYGADQWFLSKALTGVISVGHIPANRLRLIVTTAQASMAAGDFAMIAQRIEGIRIEDFTWGTANARQVMLRFGWKSPAGTYTAVIQSGAGDCRYLGAFIVSAGQANVDTTQTLVIPGGVIGTWGVGTATGLTLRITIACGTTNQDVAGWALGTAYAVPTQTNGMATINNTFELWNVGLYLDPNATGLAPPWQTPDYASELAACKRYWQKDFFGMNGYTGAASVPFTWRHPFQVEMRTSPAMTQSGPVATNCTFSAFDNVSTNSVRAFVTATASGSWNYVASAFANARM
jgi:hypothetical protein